jgi:hypothetical protein
MFINRKIKDENNESNNINNAVIYSVNISSKYQFGQPK